LGLRSSQDILDKLHEHGMQLKNHMSPLTDEQVEIIHKAFPKGSVQPEPVVVVAPPEPQRKTILVRGPIIVKEFAEQLNLKPNQLIAELMMMNIFASMNERVDLKIAQQIAEKHGFSFEHEKKQIERKPVTKAAEPAVEPNEDRSEDLTTRPPIVTFMGHVDHGKTSLLDKIRNTKVAAGEDGGITQHIGAYTVTVGNDRQITFLDTPGHAAFTQMRARGANLTDIAVIVVDAQDGIMPQTREAIQHARAAKVALMFAINKIDLRGANVDRVKTQLQKEGLAPEDWGGTTICCPVSAVTGAGIDHLLEMILLQADMLELKSNPTRRAQGFVIEARLEPGMGPTANIIVKRGTLAVGDAITCGPYWGRVKALISDKGIKVRTAGPSLAVKVLGLNAVPEPGMEFQVQANDRVARDMSELALAEKRKQEIAISPKRVTLDDLMKPVGQVKEMHKLRLILKADVQGSLEAIQNSLSGVKSDKVVLDILLASVGNISSNDVLLARASEAIIIGFHVGKDDGVNATAKREGVEIRLYSIIYELLDEVRLAMAGRLDPILRENPMGQALVKQVFQLTKKGAVAGCLVKSGRISSRARVRIRRQGGVVYEGALVSLKRFQNDASEVREGQECGLRLSDFHEYQVGDVIEAYEVQKIAQEL